MSNAAPEFNPGFVGPLRIDGVLDNARLLSRHTAARLIHEGVGVEAAVLSGVERAAGALGVIIKGHEQMLARETLVSVYGRDPEELYEKCEAEEAQLFAETMQRWREELAGRSGISDQA